MPMNIWSLYFILLIKPRVALFSLYWWERKALWQNHSLVAGRRASLSELIKSLLITSFWLWFRLGHRMSFKSAAEVSCECTAAKRPHDWANKRHLRHIRRRQALMKKTFADVRFLRAERVMRQAQTTGTGLFSSRHKTTCLSDEFNKLLFEPLQLLPKRSPERVRFTTWSSCCFLLSNSLMGFHSGWALLNFQMDSF